MTIPELRCQSTQHSEPSAFVRNDCCVDLTGKQKSKPQHSSSWKVNG
ncbi:MAG: hypothetical protein FWH04_08955 [Oscillospiraceae bacterium]|nr:hypothetical protein [Oscillospiraceae bacterium]